MEHQLYASVRAGICFGSLRAVVVGAVGHGDPNDIDIIINKCSVDDLEGYTLTMVDSMLQMSDREGLPIYIDIYDATMMNRLHEYPIELYQHYDSCGTHRYEHVQQHMARKSDTQAFASLRASEIVDVDSPSIPQELKHCILAAAVAADDEVGNLFDHERHIISATENMDDTLKAVLSSISVANARDIITSVMSSERSRENRK